jgi:hypothetical protein
MNSLHDARARQALHRRLDDLQPDSPRQWGIMRVDQMLSHVNNSLRMALGELSPQPNRAPVPRLLIKWFALRTPFPKNARTARELRATGRYEIDGERVQLRELLERVAQRPLEQNWPVHPLFGRLNGMEWSCLQHKHVDHHLRQFGL